MSPMPMTSKMPSDAAARVQAQLVQPSRVLFNQIVQIGGCAAEGRVGVVVLGSSR